MVFRIYKIRFAGTERVMKQCLAIRKNTWELRALTDQFVLLIQSKCVNNAKKIEQHRIILSQKFYDWCRILSTYLDILPFV